MANSRLLIVDDDADVQSALLRYFERCGFTTFAAFTGAEAKDVLTRQAVDVVLCDLRLPDGDGITLLPQLRDLAEDARILVFTAHGSVGHAVEAMKAGADNFVTKPIALEALRAVIDKELEHRQTARRLVATEARARSHSADPFLGESAAIARVRAQALRVVGSGRPICILGETGTGKGVLARWLQASGPRAAEPFVELNCAGLPKDLIESELFGYERGAFTGAATAKPGLIEIASNGTLFLDEIGDMDLAVQPKLLKVLEEQELRRLGSVRSRKVDVLIIAATHADLAERVAAGGFRADLFYRINTITLRMPALRERAEDLPLIVESLLGRLARGLARETPEVRDDALAAMRAYAWPGNMRELRNVLERAILLSERQVIRARDLDLGTELPSLTPTPTRAAAALTTPPDGLGGSRMRDVERETIVRALAHADGKVAAAAQSLGIPRSTLYQRIREYGLRR